MDPPLLVHAGSTNIVLPIHNRDSQRLNRTVPEENRSMLRWTLSLLMIGMRMEMIRDDFCFDWHGDQDVFVVAFLGGMMVRVMVPSPPPTISTKLMGS